MPGMTAATARDVVRLLGTTAQGVTSLVEDAAGSTTTLVYRAVEAVVGPATTPVRRVHEACAAATFGSVHAGLAAGTTIGSVVTGLVTDVALAAREPDEGSDIAGVSDTAVGSDPRQAPRDRLGSRARIALGILNGVTGDRLARDGSSLGVETTLRLDGHDVPLTRAGLAAAYPAPHGRLVVFVHGLVETEQAWRYRAGPRWGDPESTYATRIAEPAGWQPLFVRYNSGRSREENAERLADLLDALVEHWPTPVRELVLVGHSLGGLVSLTALAHDDRPWTHDVHAVVTLGSPRDGAPLERAAEIISAASGRVAAVRWVATLLGIRSQGVRDLHDPLVHPPLPPWVHEYAVHATLTPDHWHPHLPRVGDGLVPIPADPHVHTAVLHGLHHLDLLNHPLVDDVLRTWLREAQEAPVT